MTRAFGNCAFSYRNASGKPVFVPSEPGRKMGRRLKRNVERKFEPPQYYFHLQDGGHVAAMHLHRSRKYFARVDIENFFYSVSRNRVIRALRALNIAGSEKYAKWSTVKNPYGMPSYSLPYGFVQSPLLATLTLFQSPAGSYLDELTSTVTVSVFMDDIAISGNNKRVLERAYRKLVESNFTINERKSTPPGLQIELFNCHLARLQSLVTEARRDAFYALPRTEASSAAFEAYCETVACGNG